MKRLSAIPAVALLFAGISAIAQDEAIAVEGPPPQLTGLQAEAAQMVGDKQKLTQEIVDSLFSFSELGFQEFESQRYLTEIQSSKQTASPSNRVCQAFRVHGGRPGAAASP